MRLYAKVLAEAKAYAEEKRVVDNTTLEKLTRHLDTLAHSLQTGYHSDQKQLDAAYSDMATACAASGPEAIATDVNAVEEACKKLKTCRGDAVTMQQEVATHCDERDSFKSNPNSWPDMSKCTHAAITAPRISLKRACNLSKTSLIAVEYLTT